MDQFKEYLTEALQCFRKYPPDTMYQRGRLAGLLEVAKQVGLDQDLSDLEILI